MEFPSIPLVKLPGTRLATLFGIPIVKLSCTRLVKFPGILLALCLVSCGKYYVQGMFAPEGESVDKRFEQSMEYNAAHGFQTITIASDQYEVYVFTDCHMEDRTEQLDSFVNLYLQDADAAPFALCLGDLINGDAPFDSFISCTTPIWNAGRRLFLTAGNHDLFSGRWQDFRKSFGTSTYCFEVVTPSARDLFISLESGGGTLGSRQQEWLEKTLDAKSPGYRHIIVFTHTDFFALETPGWFAGKFALEETYDLTEMFSKYGVDVVLSGHRHSWDHTTFKGVDYIVVDALDANKEKPAYAVLSISNDRPIVNRH